MTRYWAQEILHDWDDETCIKILKKCKEAIPSKEKGGKVIIIDVVLDNQKEDDEFFRAQLFLDTTMLALVPGKERTKKECAQLFYKAIKLASVTTESLKLWALSLSLRLILNCSIGVAGQLFPFLFSKSFE